MYKYIQPWFPQKVVLLCKAKIKKQFDILLIFVIHSIENTANTIYIILWMWWQQYLSIQLRQGQQNTEKSCGLLQKHLFRTFHRFTGSLVTGHSNLWSWLGVKLASLIESAGVGQGSPLRETHDCVKEISTWAQEYFLKLHTVFKQGCWNRVVEGSAEK